MNIRDARAGFAGILSKAEAGEATVITRNGKPGRADGDHGRAPGRHVQRRQGHRVKRAFRFTASAATTPSHLYRLRVDDFRVAYCIDDGELLILVVKVGNRRDVYRSL